MAAEGEVIVTFIFDGENRWSDIPNNVTHLIIHENVTVIPKRLLSYHPNLVEVYCHAGVTKIEREAFCRCYSLRRVIIPGVIIVEDYAFSGCAHLIHIECDKLERIGEWAFQDCFVLNGINLPSAKIVEVGAFRNCRAMTQAIFGKDLETFGRGAAFSDCSLLQSIIIPLRNGLFANDNIFRGCVNLKRVHLIDDEFLRDIADALLRDDWRNDVHEELDSINKSLPHTFAGNDYHHGHKVIAIQNWIVSLRIKIRRYKSAHRLLVNEAESALLLWLPNDTVMNNVLPFIELPSHTLDEEDEADE